MEGQKCYPNLKIGEVKLDKINEQDRDNLMGMQADKRDPSRAHVLVKPEDAEEDV